MSNHVETFTEKAKLVSATVREVPGMAEAIAYAVDLCENKDACQLLISGCTEAISDDAEALCETKQQKIIAAPNLDAHDYAALETASQDKGFAVIREGMRKHLAGIDVGFTVCDLGIAETGTLMLNSDSEELRLSTMVSEVHVAVLPKSAISGESFDIEANLDARLKGGPSYTAFITGASRTADIERVLALGVHGPLELHILLTEG